MRTREQLERALARAKTTMTWALKSEAAPRINAMLDLARSEPGIPILPHQLDQDHWLLNCPNGTLELKTGRLREHRREDLITKLCPTEYHPAAKADHWARFVGTIFDGRQAVIRFIQKLMGYCLTGSTAEHILPIFWGAGANGKSTFMNAIMATMGEDYAIKASRDLFMAKKQDNHPAQLARLFGRRLVVAVETHEGAKLDEGMVKELTGGDPITARRMREDPWQFVPTHKCILVTNHRPVIKGTDDGIWRRVRLIPFTVRIPDERQDKALPEKLQAEAEGILAWLIEGCRLWLAEGLEPPEEVKGATQGYRQDQDLLGAFVAEICLTGPDYRCRSRDLYSAYRRWCEANGEGDPVGQRRFGETMTERGFERYTSAGTWYRGVAIRSDEREHG